MPLTDKHIDALAEAVVKKMKEEHHAIWIDPESHAEDHDFIKHLKEREELNAKRWGTFEKSMIGVITIGLGSAIAWALVVLWHALTILKGN